MKKFYLTFLSLISFGCFAQWQNRINDLDFLYQAIKKTPSYNVQLKNDKSYTALFEEIKANLGPTNELGFYKSLYRLIAPIIDNHLGLYKMVDTNQKPNPLVSKINIDSLKTILAQFPVDSIAGIYNSDGHEFGVFRSAEDEYSILHLKSRTVTGFIIQTPHRSLDFISLLNGNRGFVLARNTKHINGNFTNINLYKTAKPTFNNLAIGKTNFEFKRLNHRVDYLRLSSFYSNNVNIAAAKKFFEGVKDSINAPYLIVDVRNNSGGGFKVSQQFINFIKAYKGRVFILQNLKTASNAEKFIVRLKGRKNVITLGETTVGTLAFGNNYGNTLTLPNSKFRFYPTDTFDRMDLPYENAGVEPNVKLDATTSDWIAQVLAYIEKTL